MGKSLLTTGPVRALAQNRRRGRRHRLDIPATLIGEQSKISHFIKIIEFSNHGLGLQAGTSLTSGEIYQVLAFDTLVAPGMRIRIVSSRALPTGGFAIGGEVV
jgi:hypothetical protein